MRDAHPAELWRYTADMLYLIENPALREIYFPTTAPTHVHEPARPADWPGIEAILRRHETPEQAALIRRYWEAARETFSVSRDPGGELTGFYFLFVPRDVSPRLIDADPAAAAWREHLRSNPLPHGQIALFIRHWGTLTGLGPTPGEPSICLDIKRTYLELRPALGRVYLAVTDLGEPYEQLAALGFAHAQGFEAAIGDELWHTLHADLGPGSMDGWLADLGARELHLTGERILDPDERRLTLDGRAIDLTRLEAGVLRHLHEREGRVVTREELFRDVWGHTWTGDGNALEAVVSSLRRKLGPRASALATVRGAGYRLAALT
jgi:Transcriptional regulatory protein, C terminal